MCSLRLVLGTPEAQPQGANAERSEALPKPGLSQHEVEG